MAKIESMEKVDNSSGLGYGDLVQFTNDSDKDRVFIVMKDSVVNIEDVFDTRGSCYSENIFEGIDIAIKAGEMTRLPSGTKVILTQN